MKNYREMAEDVFRRRDQYAAMQRRRRRIGARAAACSCFCLLAIGGLWQGGVFSSSTDPGSNWPRPPASAETAAPASAQIQTRPLQGNVIVINPIEGIPASKINVPLSPEDFVPMNKQELAKYYGADIFPIVPKDLEEWAPEDSYGVYRKDKGKGAVYWDVCILNYSNEDFTRSLNIELQAGGLPLSDYGSLPKNCEKSTINGVQVGIGQTAENGYYFVEFVYKNVGFRMVAEGLSQKEIVAIVASLVKK